MNRKLFSWIAITLGVVLAAGLYFSGAMTSPEETALPLLTVLFMSELGALLCAGGAYFAILSWLQDRSDIISLIATLVAAALSLGLLYTGISLWQHNMPG